MVAYLVGNDLRRRWRAVVLLTLLVTVVVATVLASVAGARRSATAYDRYAAVVRGPDALADGDPAALDELENVDGVATTLPLELIAAFPPDAPEEEFYPLAVSLDGRIPYEYLRSPVVAGRLPDPAEAFEVAVSERTADRLDLEVGDVLPLDTYRPTPEGFPNLDGPPDGPAVELEVVGVVRDPGDIGSRQTDVTLTFLPPAFRERHGPDDIGSIGGGSMVVLEPGATLSTIAAAADDLGLNLDVSISSESARAQIRPTMSAIATALYVFAAVAALAGLATLAHLVGRIQQQAREDDGTLLALGVDLRARTARLAAPAAIAVVLGTILGLGLAIAASPRFPVGAARRAEPDPGLDVDLPVLLLGAVGASVIGLLVVATTSVLAARRTRRDVPTRVSSAGRLAAAAGAPAAVTTGLTFGRGRAPGSVARAAMGGVALGVLGLLAAVVFASSVDRLVDRPHLYGWGWDGNVAGADLSDLGEEASDDVARSLLADEDLAAVGSGVFQLALRVDDEPTLGTAIDVARGRIEPVVVRGRAPRGADEVALGRDTLDAIGKDVGDEVAVSLHGSGETMVVTGVVSLPVSTDGGTSTAGAYLTRPAIEALGFTRCADELSCYENAVFRLAPDADVTEIVDRYTDEELGTGVDLPTPPAEVERLTAVKSLPWFLAGFLALLATVAVAYAAATTVRRGRRDLAVLHGLGMTKPQLRTVVAVLVLSISTAGAVVGATLGVVLGRLVWRWTVDAVSLPFSPAVPVVAIALVPVGAIVLAQLAASVSRRQAGHLQAADLLRAE